MSYHSNMEPGGGAMPPSLRVGGREFPLSARDIAVSGTVVSLAEVPYTQANLDAIAGLRGTRERDWPYWLEDWPATYALAEALGEVFGRGPGAPASLREPILDLGCGSGFLAAFLMGRLGARVFSCDFNADACRLAALNAGRTPGRPQGAAWGCRVFCADFARFPSRSRFGLILGGEMLYARENQGPILAFLERHLAADGSAWLADPGRSAAEGFEAAARDAGFRVLRRAVSSPAAKRNVDVYRLDRPEGRH